MSKQEEHFFKLDYFFDAGEKAVELKMGKQRGINFIEFRSSVKGDTLAKLAESLNHILVYFAMKDHDKYEDLVFHIYETHCRLLHEKAEKMKCANYTSSQIPLIVKYCQLDDVIIRYICEYVADNVDNDIDESQSDTLIAINNLLANIITCVIAAGKLSYCYAQILKGSMRSDDAIREYADFLINKVITVAVKYDYFDFSEMGTNKDEIIKEIHAVIDNFIFELTAKIWDKQDSSFKIKFEEVGQDTSYYSRRHKLSILGAFKKYVPQLVREAEGKYDSVDSNNAIYYTITKDPRDFRFIHHNLTAYIHTTIDNIIRTQDAKIKLISINIPDFIDDGVNEKSGLKDTNYYEDKLRYLYDAKKSTAVKIFDMITKEIGRYDLNITFTSEFKVSKNHLFNQMILHKCLLSLTGESRVYSELFGLYNRVILLLFYLGVLAREDLKDMWRLLDIMKMETVGEPLEDLEEIEEYLKEKNFTLTTPEAFRSLLTFYRSERQQSLPPDKDKLIKFIELINSPARVRNILLPLIYEAEDDFNIPKEHEPIIDDCLDVALGPIKKWKR